MAPQVSQCSSQTRRRSRWSSSALCSDSQEPTQLPVANKGNNSQLPVAQKAWVQIGEELRNQKKGFIQLHATKKIQPTAAAEKTCSKAVRIRRANASCHWPKV